MPRIASVRLLLFALRGAPAPSQAPPPARKAEPCAPARLASGRPAEPCRVFFFRDKGIIARFFRARSVHCARYLRGSLARGCRQVELRVPSPCVRRSRLRGPPLLLRHLGWRWLNAVRPWPPLSRSPTPLRCRCGRCSRRSLLPAVSRGAFRSDSSAGRARAVKGTATAIDYGSALGHLQQIECRRSTPRTAWRGDSWSLSSRALRHLAHEVFSGAHRRHPPFVHYTPTCQRRGRGRISHGTATLSSSRLPCEGELVGPLGGAFCSPRRDTHERYGRSRDHCPPPRVADGLCRRNQQSLATSFHPIPSTLADMDANGDHHNARGELAGGRWGRVWSLAGNEGFSSGSNSRGPFRRPSLIAAAAVTSAGAAPPSPVGTLSQTASKPYCPSQGMP